MDHKYIKLPQPPLLDFTKLKKNDDVKIIIQNTQHKFSTNAEFSGTEIMKQPIFGSTIMINKKKFLSLTFGLPFIRFAQYSTPKITYQNDTLFTFNIHYHGLDTTGSIDGASMEDVFGHSTLLGPNVTFQFPKVTNNQSLLWYHSHNMFISMELVYGGLVGLLQIVDKPTEWLTNYFQYNNNQILLMALDMDLTDTGTQTFSNLVVGKSRSCFSVINGISAINWSSSNRLFTDKLYHTSNKNLVKIDILNASLNWRVFHIGVCDEDKKIRSFHLVQTDCGLMNPKKLKMTFIPIGSRIGIIIDLNRFKNKVAYLFFYDYDLTGIYGSFPTFPDQPNNSSLTGIIPENRFKNNTPYPTPIPDPGHQNQQENYTNLDYPDVNIIPQTEQILNNGTVGVPETHNIKPFLKIISDKHLEQISLHKILSQIKKTIFGHKNYDEWKYFINQPDFEYDKKFNYLSFLNKNYYFNLPKIDTPNTNNTPIRNFFLFPESNINAISGGNPNGTTECVDNTIRLMVDLWNSQELDLNWALQEYNKFPNNYKPPILPTSKFRIFKTNDEFSNTAMISNDTLIIQLFTDEIAYGDLYQTPLASTTVIFPPTTPSCKLLNLQEWIDLINDTFHQNTITIPDLPDPIPLDTILECDWSFFPYALNFLCEKTSYLKSAIIKTTNNSNYWVRFLGRWPLLQFFGKSMAGNSLDPALDIMARHRKNKLKLHNKFKFFIPKLALLKNKRLAPKKDYNLYTKCDEVGIFGIYDAEIQQIFPFYATSDDTIQLPIACMKRNAELIISPEQTYIGLYDGYLNDNLNSFSVRLHSTELWTYANGEHADHHPLHFHLTSGFSSESSSHYNPLTYSRDIYQIGPQQTTSFYLTWPNYSSEDDTKSPSIRCIGGVIHCHYMLHNDSNSMIIQYYVDKDK